MKKCQEHQLSKKFNDSSLFYKDAESKRLLSIGTSPNKLDSVLRNVLGEYGHKIISANSHYEALTYLSQEELSFVLLNIADMKQCQIEALHNHAISIPTPILYLEELEHRNRDFRSYYNDVN